MPVSHLTLLARSVTEQPVPELSVILSQRPASLICPPICPAGHTVTFDHDVLLTSNRSECLQRLSSQSGSGMCQLAKVSENGTQQWCGSDKQANCSSGSSEESGLDTTENARDDAMRRGTPHCYHDTLQQSLNAQETRSQIAVHFQGLLAERQNIKLLNCSLPRVH